MIRAVIFDWNRTLSVEGKVSRAKLETLRRLRKESVRIGILTALCGGSTFTPDILELVSAISIVEEKRPADVRALAALLGARPEETLVVGDRARNEIAAAKRCGAKALWYRRGTYRHELPRSGREQPDAIIRSIAEVLAMTKA